MRHDTLSNRCSPACGGGPHWLDWLIAIVLSILALVVLSGCRQVPQVDRPFSETSVDLGHESRQTGEIAQESRDDAKVLRTQSGTIRSTVDERTGAAIDPNLDEIEQVAVREDGRAEELDEMTKRLQETARQSESREKELNGVINQLEDKLKRATTAHLGTVIFWGLIVGGLGVAGGILLGGIMGKRLIIAGLAAGFGVALGAWLLNEVAPIFVWGLGALVAMFVIWVAWEAFVCRKGFGQVVLGVETIKGKLTRTQRVEVFGEGPGEGKLYTQQSEQTERMVRQERAKLKATRGLAPAMPARPPESRMIPELSFDPE